MDPSGDRQQCAHATNHIVHSFIQQHFTFCVFCFCFCSYEFALQINLCNAPMSCQNDVNACQTARLPGDWRWLPLKLRSLYCVCLSVILFKLCKLKSVLLAFFALFYSVLRIYVRKCSTKKPWFGCNIQWNYSRCSHTRRGMWRGMRIVTTLCNAMLVASFAEIRTVVIALHTTSTELYLHAALLLWHAAPTFADSICLADNGATRMQMNLI